MSGAAKREKEWQFAAEGLETTRAWLAGQPAAPSGRRFVPRGSVELRDTYYDSDDWMIFRAGFALRLRQMSPESGEESREVTLKGLTPARGGFANRLEFNERAPSGDITAAVTQAHALGEKVRALVGSRPLVPLFHARTQRERQILLEADTDLPLAEVDLDQTSIEAPDGQTRQLVRIEVECLNAEPAVLAPFIEELRASAGLEPAAQSKFRTGLDVAGLAASLPERLPSRSVKAAQPFAITQLARHFEALTEQEPVVRAGSVEAVHRMRVTARHLEVLVKAFASRSPSWVVRERAILRKLIKSLGHLRDRDVQIASLGPDQDLVPVREKLQQERDAAHAALVALLDTTELREWMRAWRRELAKPEARASADESTAQVARELIRAQARKLRKRGDRIDDESSPEDYHEVRIRAKRLRYLLDAFAGLYGTAATEYLAALTKLQDILGLYHDTVVLAERLSELARDAALSTSSAFALGRLVESGAPTLTVCRDKFPKAWRRVRRKRWRALEAAMQSCAEESR